MQRLVEGDGPDPRNIAEVRCRRRRKRGREAVDDRQVAGDRASEARDGGLGATVRSSGLLDDDPHIRAAVRREHAAVDDGTVGRRIRGVCTRCRQSDDTERGSQQDSAAIAPVHLWNPPTAELQPVSGASLSAVHSSNASMCMTLPSPIGPASYEFTGQTEWAIWRMSGGARARELLEPDALVVAALWVEEERN